jgi:hypothetical protein
VSPEEIVEAIWACWEKHLGDWDLEGSVANAQARRLAVEAVANSLSAARGAVTELREAVADRDGEAGSESGSVIVSREDLQLVLGVNGMRRSIAEDAYDRLAAAAGVAG